MTQMGVFLHWYDIGKFFPKFIFCLKNSVGALKWKVLIKLNLKVIASDSVISIWNASLDINTNSTLYISVLYYTDSLS